MQLTAEDAVTPPGDGRLNDRLLAAHRVDLDQRPGQVDLLQQLRDRRDLVRFGIGGDMPPRDPLLAGPSTDGWRADAHRARRPKPYRYARRP